MHHHTYVAGTYTCKLFFTYERLFRPTEEALRIRSLRILPSAYGAIYGVSNSVYMHGGAVFDLRIWPSVL